ncbi:MAG: peptide-N(4)-(N-acetyl-beta-glucosaminyl)asparagine amidase [Acidobacteriales bacterium]|nr:peptide-N(4)-(N-acetyl-beta-glucosaminyl)asparagine amidase [Terriglobales bacterium]
MVKNRKAVSLPVFALALLVLPAAFSGSAHAGQRYQIGSQNTVTADPLVPRPQGKSCQVVLFDNLQFTDFNPKSFTYTPPANCPGPWQKVVFSANFAVTAGVQFDRTGNIFVGGVPIYFGTTAEPSSDFGPNWHVETDLTDYSNLFATAQSGQVDLGNLVNDQYTGIISGSAILQFYPGTPATAPFDSVLPLSASADGGTVTLNTSADTLSGTFTLPMNVVGAYADLYLQSQSSDEFWYTCVPDDLSSELQSCPGTAYREGEVTIDGTPAGVAPVYPWIYTGGIDPYLWFPLPGVQTLNFKPYRVNLTPFAGLLSNGQPHTIAVSVFNADSYFSATGAFLLQTDKNATQVTGEVTQNTLTAPSPTVLENVHPKGSDIYAMVLVKSARHFTISGYVIGSEGMVQTSVAQNIDFSNKQTFTITDTQYVQNILQSTSIDSEITTNSKSGNTISHDQLNWPLTLNYSFLSNSDGTSSQTATINQAYNDQLNTSLNGKTTYASSTQNMATPTDTLEFDAAGNLTGNQGQRSQQRYTFHDNTGACYDITLRAANNVLTGVKDGCQ